MRFFRLATLALVLAAAPVSAKVMAPPGPSTRALRSEVVVVAKVTALEKETVDVKADPNSPNTTPYTIALLKVEQGLTGAAGLTHLKVGFVQAETSNVPRRRPFGRQNLTEGQTGIFFLVKHPEAGFYTIAPLCPPVDASAEDYQDQLTAVKRVAAVLADPAKALKAEAAEARALAATTLISKYCGYPYDGREMEPEPLPVEESRALLTGLAGGNWSKIKANEPDPYQAFAVLSLQEADGWKPAPFKGGDFRAAQQAAFTKWLAGPGQNYRVKKLVPKK